MTVQERNTVKMLNFAGPHLDARCVEQVRDFAIDRRTIVINPRLEPAVFCLSAASILCGYLIVSGWR
jgi:hypothetical protein